MSPEHEMLGDPEHAVRHAVHLGRERFGDDPNPHAATMQRGGGSRPGCAVARARTVGDIYPPPAAAQPLRPLPQDGYLALIRRRGAGPQ
jgi:hypothetical protein